jgi:hypothetical protein
MSKKFALLCAFVIAAVALVIFLPGLKIGHEGGWWYLEWAAKLSLPDYLWQYFDPGHVTQGYRPMQGMMVLGEYSLFGVNSDGYHLAQIAMHIVTCWLLFAVVWRLSKHARLAFISALIFAGLPAFHLAIFRAPAVVDPWAGMFYLGTIVLWINYLESRQKRYYALTIVVFALSLLSKEISVFLPILLFLIDRWFVKKETTLALVARQYLPFFVVMIPFLLLELNVQSHGEFSRDFGYKVGPQFLLNLIPYLSVLSFPWYTDNFVVPANGLLYTWLAVVGIALAGIALARRSLAIVFLIFFAVVNISPLLGFPLDWFQARYLYVSLMSSAILMAMGFEVVAGWLRIRGVPSAWLVAPILAALLVVNGQAVSVKAAEWAEYTRVIRVPFRDISRQHPSFPEDTYLYFVYPTTTDVWDLEGLFFVRYGKGITVDGTDAGRPANLRDHSTTFVYYFDQANRPIEIPVDQNDTTRAAPPLPTTFQVPISLEGYEVPSGTIKRGTALIAILNWRTFVALDKDYTVFAHLVDPNGKTIAAYDGFPKRGTLPTSTWRPGLLTVDAVVLPVDADAPIGDGYRLEVGMYDSATMQRLAVLDSNGQPRDDKIVIEPFRIVQ